MKPRFALFILALLTLVGCSPVGAPGSGAPDASATHRLAAGGPYALLLSGTITSSSSSLTVTDGSLAPLGSPGFTIQIDSEQLLVTAISGNVWSVTRGINSTSAAAHTQFVAVTILSAPTIDAGQFTLAGDVTGLGNANAIANVTATNFFTTTPSATVTTTGSTATSCWSEPAETASTSYDYIATVVGQNTPTDGGSGSGNFYRADLAFSMQRLGTGDAGPAGAAPVPLNVRTTGAGNTWGACRSRTRRTLSRSTSLGWRRRPSSGTAR